MIGAVVLAAGGSSRMGRPKQLLMNGGTTLVERAVGALQGSLETVMRPSLSKMRMRSMPG